MTDKSLFAYFAGYTDGDGCFHISQMINKKTGITKFKNVFIVSSTNLDILHFFCIHFGGSCKLSSNKNIAHKLQYHFKLGGKKSINLIEKIYPFLVEKRKEANIFIQFIKKKSKEEKNILYNLLREVKEKENLVYCNHVASLKKISNTITPTVLDYSYLAGFIDAECCLGIARSKDKKRPNYLYKTYLHCNNTKFPVFQWLMERFGGQIRFIDRTKYPNHRNQLAWRISSKALSKILPNIFPCLQYKKAVCQELIKFDETTLTNGGARHTEEFRSSYAIVLQTRETIFNQVHFLNRKGVNH